MGRLQEAMELYLERTSRTVEELGETDDAFIERNVHLADILEPLLQGEQPEAGAHETVHIPGYRIIGELGRGGAGIVYEAEHERLGRRVAIKVLSPERRLDPRCLARFRREARFAGSLEHPAIVALIDAGTVAGVEYLVQELIPGGHSLADVIDEARRQPELDITYWERVAGLIAQAAEGLAVAHAAGIVHRDVKPGNLLVTPGGALKVADFGLARSEDSLAVSHSLATIGTPFYMSPEQTEAGAEVGPASDVFALGATLYEALTLRRPFEGASAHDVLERVRVAAPTDPRQLTRELPATLAAIALKCLERRPEDRYSSMTALAQDLVAFLHGEPVAARPPSIGRRWRCWVRVHPVRATLTLGTTLLLLTIVVAASLVARESERLLELSDEVQVRALIEGEAELWPVSRDLVPAAESWLAKAHATRSRRLVFEERLREIQTAQLASPGLAIQREQWLHGQLAGIVEAFETLGDAETGLIADVGQRLALARRTAASSLESDTARRAWTQARAAIAEHPAYHGLLLDPQYGLLPLGPDPASGLWEFADLISGEAPSRDSTGELRLLPQTGVVLVLLPGGEFWMGAQDEDPGSRNFDPHARDDEQPVHAVRIRPFLFGKYELTQGQWHHLTAAWPSHDHPAEGRELLPVEQISWGSAKRELERHALRLPSESEWEYGARAGTQGPFFFDESRLREYANVKDLASVLMHSDDPRISRDGKGWYFDDRGERFEFYDDGFRHTAPVGSMLPNAWGIHDVSGNVIEWCEGSYGPYPGARNWGQTSIFGSGDDRLHRGGGYHRIRMEARSAVRSREHGSFVFRAIGARAVRSLEYD